MALTTDGLQEARCPDSTGRRRPVAAARMFFAAALVALSLRRSACLAPMASAAQGDPFLNSCMAVAASATCPAGSQGQTFPVILSPDNRFLYVGLWGSPAGPGRSGLRRESAERSAEPQLLRHDERQRGACAVERPAPALRTTWPWTATVEISTPPRCNSLVVYDRNPTTGAVVPKAGGRRLLRPGRRLHGRPRHLPILRTDRVSPTGERSTSRFRTGLSCSTATRDTGALTQKAGDAGCLTETAVATCKDVVGLGSNGFQARAGPAGKQLYVPIQSPGGVVDLRPPLRRQPAAAGRD